MSASDAALLARVRTAVLDAEVAWAGLVAETRLWELGNTSFGRTPRRLAVYASAAGFRLQAATFGARDKKTPAAAAEQAWSDRLEVRPGMG